MPFARFPSARARGVGVAVAAAGLLALALAGCTGAPTPTPTPTESSAEPIFASDEEALAAAVEAYQAFETISLQIAKEGGVGPERIEGTATDRYLPQLLDEFDQYRELGIRVEGQSSIDSTRLAEYTEDSDGARVALYVCRDVTGVRVLDSAGSDVTPADRDDRTPLIAFLISEPSKSHLLVDNVELWSGDDFC